MEYLYEMHCHTTQSSRCSHIDGAALARYYKSIGAQGICVTDHFLNAPSTTAPDTLPWEQRVRILMSGFEAARREGERIGLQVFCGWEYAVERSADFLTYGLDGSWLLAHPEVMTCTLEQYCTLVRSSGGMVIQAHPFRAAPYISMIRLAPWYVDGVEVCNADNTDFENTLAEQYARDYGLPGLCGSDNHFGSMPYLALLSVERKADSLADLLGMIRRSAYTIRKLSPT